MRLSIRVSVGAFLVWMAFGAIVATAGPDTPEARGKILFEDTEDYSYPSCAHCHAVKPDKDEKKLKHVGPGSSLWGSAKRGGWRNMKTYKYVGEALQYCAKTWQKRRKGIKGEKLTDLVAYLELISPEPLKARKLIKKPKKLKKLDGGDATKGHQIVEHKCAGCHSAADTAYSFDLRKRKRRVDQIARKVRGYDEKSKFKPQKGQMSYYSIERLSDDELRHVLAAIGK
ncbi:MAG: hypothetical protein V3T86_16340 [Planctomycetota bacterium]